MPVNLDFESPAEAKGFKAVINLDSKVVDFASGITGKINFKNLGVQCQAIYGCLLRKEEITATSSPLSKRKNAFTSDELPEHPAYLWRACSTRVSLLLLAAQEL